MASYPVASNKRGGAILTGSPLPTPITTPAETARRS